MGFTARPTRAVSGAGRRLRSLVPAAACVATLSIASTSTTAVAQESPLTRIISQISRHEATINTLNLEIGNLRETVNQALVDLHDAQSLAEQARLGAQEARNRLNETQVDVERAQAELDEVSRVSYRASGSSAPAQFGGGDARKESLDRQTYLRQQSEEKRATLDELQRARTEAANYESTLRQASKLADERAVAAETAEAEARETLDVTVQTLATSLDERDAAVAELESAQEELVELRPEADPAAEEGAGEGAAAGDGAAAETSSEVTETAQTSESAEQSAEPGKSDVPAESSESLESLESLESEADQTAEEAGEPAAPESAEESEPAEGTEATEATEDADGAEETEVEAGAEVEAEDEAGETVDAGSPEFTLPTLADFADPEVVNAAMDAFAEAVGDTQAEHTSFDNPYGEESEGDSGEEGIAATSSSDEADAAVVETDEGAETDVAGVLPELKDEEETSEEIRGAADGDREAQIEAVIARAEAQKGTPYVWGGGDANGPTGGLEGGQSGYDCSGLVLYAFAGAGISLPHYTGYQYQRGQQIPVDEAERGDLLFWGEGGSQHVAIYLGDGMMLEAPQSGMNVQESPVRYNGLAPHAVRLI